MLVLAACQLQTDSTEKESQATAEQQVETVVTETVVVEREVERAIDATLTTARVVRAAAEEPVSETPEPEAGRVDPAQEELDAVIRAVIQASNLAHVDALRTASIDPLLDTVSGPWLQACDRWVANLRQAGLYAAIQLQDLEILSVGVLKPDESMVVATTIERWSEIEYRRQWDDRVVAVDPSALYYETYFMFMENGQWKIWDIQIDEQPYLTLVNVVGPVFVNDQPAVENRVIHPGDLVRTAGDGFASLIYSNGGVTHLGSDTNLELVELEGAAVAKAPGLARPLAQGRFARWRQWAGSTWNTVRDTVICSVAACSVPRQTRFAVHVAGDQSTSVEVFKGVVDVSSADEEGEPIPDRSVTVEEGKQTRVRPMEPPATPFPIGRLADLVITAFETTGPVERMESGRLAVPGRLVIRNQGDIAAGLFKVSIGYVGPMIRAPAPTVVPGQDGSWHIWTDEPIGPGSEIVLEGRVTFRSDLEGQEISLFALADSCAGDEYMGLPAFCRVEESDENNNESPLLPVTLTPTAPPRADLAITALETTGSAALEESGRITVPVRMVIRNQGGTAAAVFKISTDYIGPKGRFLAPLILEGQEDPWYGWTSEPLGAGSQVELRGKVTLSSELGGETVSLIALADSCAGEELVPEFCRIEESNEENNESAPLPVELPLPEPIVRSIQGTVRYRDQPLPQYTALEPNFWMRDESEGTAFEFEHAYNTATGEYVIYDVPEGRYGIQVSLDVDGNGYPFPGDYYAWDVVSPPGGEQTLTHDIDLVAVIHLTAPTDTASQLPMTPPYPVHAPRLAFTWEYVPGANRYRIEISEYTSPPDYAFFETVVVTETTTPFFSADLPPNAPDRHYQLKLDAYDTGNKRIGTLMINYVAGMGWDYRFRTKVDEF